MKKIDLKNKKVRLFIVLAVCILLIGGTYAYWILTLTQTGTNKIASSSQALSSLYGKFTIISFMSSFLLCLGSM